MPRPAPGVVMGVYDREYYRGEKGAFGGFAGPSRAVHWLVLGNIAVFILQMATQFQPGEIAGPVTNALDLNVSRVLHGQVWRLVTYSFLHSNDILHIVFNMYFLWMFGRAVEDIYGAKEFLAFYLASAIMGALAFVALGLIRPEATAIGASGAVMAVMVLFAMHYPRTTIYLFFLIPIPIYIAVILFVAIDALSLLGGSQEPIAFAIHLGGAAFGFLYYRFQWRVLNWWPTRMSMRPRRLVGPRLRVYREAGDDEPERDETSEVERQFEAQVDAVLEKVQRYGQASLSEREHQILLKASEVYKQRRK
ncbi:MAG: rhomboid family intramembrane serine protease [Gemmataceae bacterium]